MQTTPITREQEYEQLINNVSNAAIEVSRALEASNWENGFHFRQTRRAIKVPRGWYQRPVFRYQYGWTNCVNIHGDLWLGEGGRLYRYDEDGILVLVLPKELFFDNAELTRLCKQIEDVRPTT